MPKVIKKRPAKKKSSEENEVKSAARQALEKIRDRQRHVIIGVSVLAAIVALFVGTSLYSTSQYKKASSLEREATNYYYGENIDKTLPGKERLNKALQLFIRSTDIKVTPTNLYYLGNTYFRLNDYENAISAYTRFITKFRSEEAILPLVYQKLASSYFKTGNNTAGLETLGKLATLEGGIFKDTALLYEARHFEEAGKKEDALERYREIFTQFPSSPWAVEANAKLSAEEAGKGGDKTAAAPGGKTEQPAQPVAHEKNRTDQPGNTQERGTGKSAGN
jgi:tetratricopeptide (TPR) repeat protein